MRARGAVVLVGALVLGVVGFVVASRPVPAPTESLSVLAFRDGGTPATPPPASSPPATPPPVEATASRSAGDGISPLVLRVDAGHAAEWRAVRAALAAPVFEGPDPWYAWVDYVDDPAWYGMDQRQVLARLGAGYRHSFVVLVDEAALTSPEHAVLVVSTSGAARGQSFRALPVTLQSIDNNLSESNLDWADFAAAVGPDGVFRGF